jgi:hypothetical protein
MGTTFGWIGMLGSMGGSSGGSIQELALPSYMHFALNCVSPILSSWWN